MNCSCSSVIWHMYSVPVIDKLIFTFNLRTCTINRWHACLCELCRHFLSIMCVTLVCAIFLFRYASHLSLQIAIAWTIYPCSLDKITFWWLSHFEVMFVHFATLNIFTVFDAHLIFCLSQIEHFQIKWVTLRSLVSRFI